MKNPVLMMIAVSGSILLTACSGSNAVTPHPSSSDLNTEAQAQAEQIVGLIYAKCGDAYYRSGYSPRQPTLVDKPEVKASPNPIDEQERFLGYEWIGKAAFVHGGQPPFEIYRRAGKWFLRLEGSRQREDVPVEVLQPIRPECPMQ